MLQTEMGNKVQHIYFSVQSYVQRDQDSMQCQNIGHCSRTEVGQSNEIIA
jgi:hypothetical protein